MSLVRVSDKSSAFLSKDNIGHPPWNWRNSYFPNNNLIIFLRNEFLLLPLQIAAQSTRQLSTTVARASKAEVAEGYTKLKDVQARFQVRANRFNPIIFLLLTLISNPFQRNDGKPVHLKKGATDAIMYYSTMAASAVGVLGAGHLFYSIIWPAKDE